jgi:hypothetical protein
VRWSQAIRLCQPVTVAFKLLVIDHNDLVPERSPSLPEFCMSPASPGCTEASQRICEQGNPRLAPVVSHRCACVTKSGALMNTGSFFWEERLSQRGRRLIDVRRASKG